MPELFTPTKTIQGRQIVEYRFSDGGVLKELTGFGEAWYCGPDGKSIMAPKEDDGEPFTRRVRAAKTIVSLIKEDSEILRSNQAVWFVLVAEGVTE